MALSECPKFLNPDPTLEQYLTPANIAAHMIHRAYMEGNIENCTVCDLGCGTGILSWGAAIAGAKEVHGFDVDKNALKAARNWGQKEKCEVIFYHSDVKNVKGSYDTVIMNPPFGSQKKHADMPFIKKACELSETVFSFHNANSLPFLKNISGDLGFSPNWVMSFDFPIRSTYSFHTQNIHLQPVIMVKMTRIKKI